MDHADLAAPIIAAEIQAGIARTKHQKSYSVDCIACGVVIPAARQTATNGTDHCLDCAARQERV